jgi:hypothetical protein
VPPSSGTKKIISAVRTILSQILDIGAGRLNVRDLRQPANVDNFLEEVLGGIFGRFFTGHRPWRWRPGGFFDGRGAFGKMG